MTVITIGPLAVCERPRIHRDGPLDLTVEQSAEELFRYIRSNPK